MPNWPSNDNFSLYPPKGREIAISYLAALREMPVALLPVFLVDLKDYDWKFPVEQREIVTRLEFLRDNPSSCAGFRSIKIPVDLESSENVKDPQQFLANMTAYLWSSLQMDTYRRAADEFVGLYEAKVRPNPPARPRLVMIIIGREAGIPTSPLFHKLAGSGLICTNVRTEGAAATILAALTRRSVNNPDPYAHWYVDGGSPLTGSVPAGVTQLFYPSLAPINKQILAIMKDCIQNGNGPEVLRLKLAELTRQMPAADKVTSDARLQQFAVTVLTQGSGTQIFSTSFVQWATREILRRAQPSTVLARYAPRQRQKPFNAMVADALSTKDLDPEGSLIDADMAAFYGYLELKRLPGSDRDGFFVWFEDHPQVFIAAPNISPGTEDNSPISVSELLSKTQVEA